MLILSSKTAAPNVKKNGFTMEILTFLKNSRFCIERSVWELFGTFLISFWCTLWCLWGSYIDQIWFAYSCFCPKKNRICPKNNVELNVVRWTCQRR